MSAASRTRLADFGETLTVEEAGRMLGISRGCAYEAARTGELPTVKIGRRVIVPRCRLASLLGVEEFDRSDGDDVGGTVRDSVSAG